LIEGLGALVGVFAEQTALIHFKDNLVIVEDTNSDRVFVDLEGLYQRVGEHALDAFRSLETKTKKNIGKNGLEVSFREEKKLWVFGPTEKSRSGVTKK
jgi:hypothetical protein